MYPSGKGKYVDCSFMFFKTGIASQYPGFIDKTLVVMLLLYLLSQQETKINHLQVVLQNRQDHPG